MNVNNSSSKKNKLSASKLNTSKLNTSKLNTSKLNTRLIDIAFILEQSMLLPPNWIDSSFCPDTDDIFELLAYGVNNANDQ